MDTPGRKIERCHTSSHCAQHQNFRFISKGARNVQKYWNNQIYKQLMKVHPVSKPCLFLRPPDFHFSLFGVGWGTMFLLLFVFYINYIRFWASWTSSATRWAVIWLPYNVLAVHAPNHLVAVAHKTPFACWACSLQMNPAPSVTRNNLYVQSILGF